MKFHGSNSSGGKRVAEEEIIEVEDMAIKQPKLDAKIEKKPTQLTTETFKKPQNNRIKAHHKSSLVNLVKRKSSITSTTTSDRSTTSTAIKLCETVSTKTVTPLLSSLSSPSPSPAAVSNALSMLGGYNSNSDDSE